MPEITLTTVRGINCSDPRSFRSLYDAYYSYLCGLAASYIHDFEKARELVNDVFLRVWERRTEFKYPPLPYLISSVRNACYNYLRDVRKASMVTLEFVERIPDTALYDENEVEDIMQLISGFMTFTQAQIITQEQWSAMVHALYDDDPSTPA